MAELTVDNLSIVQGGDQLLADASLVLEPGELVAVIGPNGAGKSTLIKTCVGALTPAGGFAHLDGAPVHSLGAMARARLLAYLPQIRPLAWPNKVRDVVALGRFAYGASPTHLNQEDTAAVAHAMARCAIEHLADRNADTLSGGELARVHFARAFAAQTPLLIADEPTAALDPKHQLRIMDLIRSYVDEGGGALIVSHDIELAGKLADRLVWMKDGRILADGPPAKTLNARRMAEVFEVSAHVEGHKIDIQGTL